MSKTTLHYIRRKRKIQFGPEMLALILKEIFRDLPRDSSLMDVFYDTDTGVVQFTFHSEAFESIPSGCCTPVILVSSDIGLYSE